MNYNPHCQRCTRLAQHLKDVQQHFPTYHCAPVAPRGEKAARLLIVGLAPGLHGANATGIPFHGDSSGDFLFRALIKHSFAQSDNGIKLNDCRITNAVKCLPPQNKPIAAEINSCNDYLKAEIEEVPDGGVILALGTVAHKAIVRALSLRQTAYRFGHSLEHPLTQSRILIDSYHCSRYNTQTGRLTVKMLDDVLLTIRQYLV